MDDIVKRPAYDPNNLDPDDEEARKHDTKVEGIDWDEIIASTQDDWLAGRHAFDDSDCPDDESAIKALEKFIDDVFDEVMREKDSPVREIHTTRARRP
jgi:hypothetical protein